MDKRDATAKNLGDYNGDSLPADSFWNEASGATIAADYYRPCMGIELNLWERAKVTISLNSSNNVVEVIVIIEVITTICLCTGTAHAHVGGWWWPSAWGI
jgi:hypothetical protein